MGRLEPMGKRPWYQNMSVGCHPEMKRRPVVNGIAMCPCRWGPEEVQFHYVHMMQSQDRAWMARMVLIARSSML